MRHYKNVEEAYDICVVEGNILPKDSVEEGIIESSLFIVKEEFILAKEAVAKKLWTCAYKSHYDIFHQLAEIFVRCDKMKIKNHLCLFVYLCVKHPELELNWDFFEKVRTKYTLIKEESAQVSQKDWQDVSLPFLLYIGLLKEKIEEKLSS